MRGKSHSLNIAFLAPYTPTRIRTRSFHFLKTLAQLGHRLTLFTVWSDQTERDALAQIKTFDIRVIATHLTRRRAVWNSLRAAPTRIPLQAYYSWEPGLARTWMDALRNSRFDVVHVEHLRGAQYARAAVNALGELPLVWDSVDCISALFEQTRAKSASAKNRLISQIEYPRTRAYEAALIRLFPQTLVVSEAERRALLALPTHDSIDPTERVHVVPIGIDLEYFTRRTESREAATIVFSGKMSYHANITAAYFLLDEIMPRVWAQLPHVRVQIVGANPPRALLTRAAASDGRLTVTGTVSDIRPYLAGATLAVAPMVYAAGMQFKILEAMAMETPVIATPAAAAPLGARAGHDLVAAASAEEFANRIVEMLGAPERQTRFAANGRAFVATHLSWRTSVDKLLGVYTLAQKSADAATKDTTGNVHLRN